MAVFLAGYKHGHMRSRIAGRREMALLAEPAWFLDRLEYHGCKGQLEVPSKGIPPQIQQASIAGVATLRPGVIFEGALTAFDLETYLQWQYVGRPEASYSVQIDQFFEFPLKPTVHARKGEGGHGKPMALNHWLFQPSSPLKIADVDFEGKASLAWLAYQLLPVIWLPEPILTLICKGSWTSLLLHLSRTAVKSCSTSILACLRQLQALMAWPSQEQFQALAASRLRFVQQPCTLLTEDSVGFLMECVCKHSDVLITDGGLEGDEVALRQRRCLLEKALEGIRNYMEALSRPTVRLKQSSSMAASLIIDSIRAVRHLRNRGCLAQMRDAVIASFLPTQLQALVKSCVHNPASGSSISRYQVILDASFAMVFREMMLQRDGPIYLWADSSPQAGHDFLLSVFDQIASDKLVQCLESFRALFLSVEALRQAIAAEDFEAAREVAKQRDAAGQVLTGAIMRHHQMPMGLGSGATTLEHKCQALATKFSHEAASFKHLRSLCSDVIGVTVDLGTESGLSDVCGGDVVSYLPPWMARLGQLQEDAGLDAVPIASTKLFPNSLISPGLDHVANNLQDAMDQQLQGWEAWLPGFKALAYLLSHRYLLQRLVARCVRGTPHAALASCFESCVQPVAKWRWGTICKTLPSILRLERAMRIVWDQQKFLCKGETLEEDENSGGSFQCSLITTVTHDRVWWAYGHMLLQLHNVGNHASSWGSCCPCHEWMTLQGKAEHVAQTQALSQLRKSLGPAESQHDGVGYDCPLKGKRGPEMANGNLLRIVRELADELRTEVLLGASSVQSEDRERIINDYNLGCQFIHMSLELKTGHWGTLPWVLARLALPAAAVDHKSAARAIIEEFERLPSDPVHHHAITWKVLQPRGVLRQQLERVAEDMSLDQLPELRAEICKLAFIPVVERIVEGAHSLVHRHTGYRKVTGAYVSTSLRFPEIDKVLEGPWRDKFVTFFEELRKRNRVVKHLRLQEHPQWIALVSKPKSQQTGARKLPNAMVYSVDATTMFVKHDEARKKNESHKKEFAKAKKSLLPDAPAAVCIDNVRRAAQTSSVLDTLQVGEFYSIPASAVTESSTMSSLKPDPQLECAMLRFEVKES